MNIEACSNCVVHGWKQLEDKTKLQQCSNCKVIQYCSQECQWEHWRKVHSRHCQHFVDPTKNEAWDHKELSCLLCIQAAVVGDYNLTQTDNPNYACIHKELLKLPPHLHHPHPFPIAGDPGDIREKAVIVLWQLIHKFQLMYPKVCQEELLKIQYNLGTRRLTIWRNRKTFPRPEAVMSYSGLNKMLSKIENNMETSTFEDPFQLWQIIMLVAQIEYDVDISKMSEFLKDPLVSLTDDTEKLVSEGLGNISRYLTVANDVLEALATKVIPYQEVLKIICGGSLEQKCIFCFKEVVINCEYFSNDECDGSTVFFTPLLLDMYICEGNDCYWQGIQKLNDYLQFNQALHKMEIVRKVNTCDFCFRRTPIKEEGSNVRDIHRCSYCRTTMYCSMDCLLQDWKIHLKVCKKDEGRKKKLCSSARRDVARREAALRSPTLDVVDIFLFTDINDGGTNRSGQTKDYEIKFKVNENALLVFDIDKQMTDFHEACSDHENHVSQYGSITWEPENGCKEIVEGERINGAKFYAQSNVKITLGLTMMCNGFGTHEFDASWPKNVFPRDGKYKSEDLEVEVLEVNGRVYEEALEGREYIPLAVLSFQPLVKVM